MAGLVDLFYKDLRWALISTDDQFSVHGQFTSVEVQERLAANYSEFRSLGRAQPILMFSDNDADVITFDVRVFAQHNGILGLFGDKVDDLINDIRGLTKPVPKFGRPRIFAFAVGDAISMTCVVADTGPMAYDRLRPITGDHRGVTTTITLKRYEEYDVTLSGSQAESLVQPFYSGESYEGLCQRIYGNPNLGEPLRRRNPELPTPSVGEFIHVPPQASLRRGFALTPQSPALKSSDRNLARREAMFRDRNMTHRSYSLGADWDGV